MGKYIVQVSPHHKEIVNASSAMQARKKAWNRIKNGFTYGWKTWTRFQKVKVKQVD